MDRFSLNNLFLLGGADGNPEDGGEGEERQQRSRTSTSSTLAANSAAANDLTQQLLLAQQNQQARTAALAAGYSTPLQQYLRRQQQQQQQQQQQTQQQQLLQQQRGDQLAYASLLAGLPGVQQQPQPPGLAGVNALDSDHLLLQLLQEQAVAAASSSQGRGANNFSNSALADLLFPSGGSGRNARDPRYSEASAAAADAMNNNNLAASSAAAGFDDSLANSSGGGGEASYLPSADVYAEHGILGPWSSTSAGLMSKMVSTGLEAGSSKGKRIRKKPKDRPKRPLSAYNIFFKEERQRILKTIPEESSSTSASKPSPADAKQEEHEGDDQDGDDSNRKRKKSPHGKIGFENLARTIGQRWQQLSEEEVEYYKKIAATDMTRYKAEMEVYLTKQRVQKQAEEDDDGDDDNLDDGRVIAGIPSERSPSTSPKKQKTDERSHY